MFGSKSDGLVNGLEALITLVDALDFLWSVFGSGEERPVTWRECRRVFPEDGSWYWARDSLFGEERIEESPQIEVLDARWDLLEKVFYAHEQIAPFMREWGDDKPPRPVEAWEWSCFGLHSLWEGWRHPRGEVRAELRPATFTLDEDHHSEDVKSYEVYFLYDRVRALRDELLREKPRPVAEKIPVPWSEAVVAYARKHGFGPGDLVDDLLDAMVWEGLAVDDGSTVILKLGHDGETRVSVSDFETVASVAILRSAAASESGASS